MVRMRGARALGRLLPALTRAIRHTGQTRAVEGERSNIASVSCGLEHAQNASISHHVDANTRWWRRAKRTRGTSRSRNIASSAVAATNAAHGIGERHSAAFLSLLSSERQWSGGGLEQTSKKIGRSTGQLSNGANMTRAAMSLSVKKS
jgi:hypothetical protein